MQFMVENEEKINMMNRIIIGLLTVAAASCFGAVASAGNGANTNVVCNQYCAYQDADGDGICDNQGNCGRNYADADKDGVCDNQGNCGRNFVDADKDGVCDNQGSCGKNYVDADKDGVCDNIGTRACRGQRRGRGRCGR